MSTSSRFASSTSRGPGRPTTGGGRIDALRSEARYHRERLDLYRARAYGMRPTSPERLRELQRASDLAEERLQTALREAARA
jgi:hypothetical protein